MLVDITELAQRLPFDLDTEETREAQGALEDLSFDAQAIGSGNWTTKANTPQAVKNLILRAAARHMKNYEGYTVSRAGDETVQWGDRGESSGTATFTEDEKQLLRTMGGNRKFIGGVGVNAYGTSTRKVVYVPTTSGSPLRGFFNDPVEPW